MKGCQAVKSVRDGSFFSMSRLPLRTILKLMYRWSVKDQVSKTVKECGVSQRVVVIGGPAIQQYIRPGTTII